MKKNALALLCIFSFLYVVSAASSPAAAVERPLAGSGETEGRPSGSNRPAAGINRPASPAPRDREAGDQATDRLTGTITRRVMEKLMGPGSSGDQPLSVLERAKLKQLIRQTVLEVLQEQNKSYLEAIAKPIIQVRHFYPQHTVPTEWEAITLTFTRRVVTEDEVGKFLQYSPVEFDPPIKGRFRFSNPFELEFLPDGELAPATSYRVDTGRSFTTGLGKFTVKKQVFNFHTASPKLESIRKVATRRNKVTLDLAFNCRVSPTEVSKHLTITDHDRNRIPYELSGLLTSDKVRIEVKVGEERDLVLTISKGLRAEQGNLNSERHTIFLEGSDTTLKFNSHSAYSPSGSQPYCYLYFDDDLEKGQDFKQFIAIEPAVDIGVEFHDHYLKLRGDFEPGKSYSFTIKQGLKGTDGEYLKEDVTRTVPFPGLKPDLRFISADRTYHSAGSNLVIPLDTVETDTVEIQLEHIYNNNVVHFINRYRPGSSYNPDYMGLTVAGKKIPVTGEINKWKTVSIDLKEIEGADQPGISVLTAWPPKRSWRKRKKLICITDIGIWATISGHDLLVWTSSIAAGNSLGNCEVTVYTKTNQIITSGSTNVEGIAHFKDLDMTAGDSRPFLITASRGEDLSYLKIDRGNISHTDFDTGGRGVIESGYEAYLYTDRGIYRPGDTLHIRGVVRGPRNSLPGEFPVTIDIIRPDRKKLRTLKLILSDLGTFTADFSVPGDALTGEYRLMLFTPASEDAVGSTTVQVEDFMPDRMKAELSLSPVGRRRSGDTVTVTVNGKHLYGKPASGRDVTAVCTLRTDTFSHPDWKGFTFTDIVEEEFSPFTLELGKQTLDDQGQTVFECTLPRDLKPGSSLLATFSATVMETGGRGVSARQTLPVDPYPFYCGLKSVSAPKGREHEQAIFFECAAVTPGGEPAPNAGEFEYTVGELYWNWALRRGPDGRYHYISEREEVVVARGTVTLEEGRGIFSFKPETWETYRVRVQAVDQGASDQLGGPSVCLEFSTEEEATVAAVPARPDRLQIITDRTSYHPGDKARVTITSPFAEGRLLLVVQREKVLSYEQHPIRDRETTVEIDVKEEFAPNVYLTAVVVKPPRSTDKLDNYRAYGIEPLRVNCTDRHLDLTLDAPGKTKPGTRISVTVTVTGADAAGTGGEGQEAEISLAAVDEGILQLTGFETPDPWDFFYGKKRLATRTADLYSLIFPEYRVEAAGTGSEPGGDRAEERRKRMLAPVAVKRVKSIVLWTSPIRTGKDGKATIELTVPNLIGALRIMAVAVGASSYAGADTPVLVKPDLVLETSLPRFLSTGDTFKLPVSAYNDTGKAGTAKLTVSTSGSLKIADRKDGDHSMRDRSQRSLYIGRQEEKRRNFFLQADALPGKAVVRVEAGLHEELTTEETELAVRPPAPLISLTGAGSLEGTDSLREGEDAVLSFPPLMMPDTSTATIMCTTVPAITLGKSLRELIRYPYGCVEQTSSSLFPLLYLKDVAEMVEPSLTEEGNSIDRMVQSGIYRLLSMQTHSGALSMWPGSTRVHRWGTLYGAHCLIEAEKAGYIVPATEKKALVNYIRTSLKAVGGTDRWDRSELACEAYACYVLALAGEVSLDRVRALLKKEDLAVYSRYQLAAACYMAGQYDEALSHVGDTLPSLDSSRQRDTGGVFDSHIRELAILLDTLLTVSPDSPRIVTLVKALNDKRENERYLTTQENSFSLMAMGKYARTMDMKEKNFTARCLVNGETVREFTHLDSPRITIPQASGKEVRLNLKGKGTLYYFWVLEGVPVSGRVDETDRGVVVRRTFKTTGGAVVDPLEFEQGKTYVVEYSIKASRELENFVINDPLPGGLEIENPRINTRAALDWPEEDTVNPDYMDIRDDRLLLFLDIGSTDELFYRYLVRAVTVGRFRLPALCGECMYDPGIRSVSGQGLIKVKE